jgi:hypothetical protein
MAPKKTATTKTAAEKKTAAHKTTTKKKAAAPKATTATKTSTTKKTATKKPAKEPKVKAVFQYQDLEFTEASCVKKAQAGFKKAHKGVDLKDISIYIKPEEGKIYYVANGDINGSVDL